MLKVNGKPFQVVRFEPTVKRVLSVLEQLPSDEVLTTIELSKRCGVGINSLRQGGPQNELAGYSAKVQGTRYWGQKQAIQELQRVMQ